VQLHAQGIVLRDEVVGADIKTKKQQVCRAGEFLVAEIDAKVGGFGIVPESLDGAIVSSHYFLFSIDESHLVRGFLDYYVRTPAFREQVGARGSTNYAAIRASHVLGYTIPLPPLAEQRRIVAKIDELAAKIAEARGLRCQSYAHLQALGRSSLELAISSDAPTNRLGDLIAPGSTLSYGVLVPGPDVENGVPFVRVQDLDPCNPSEQPNKRIAPAIDAQYARTRLKGGEVLIGVVGSIGKVGIAPVSWAGANIARAVCRIVPGPQIDRQYLASVLGSGRCQHYFREATRTLAQPTLNVGQLTETQIPTPPLAEQRRIVAYLDDLQAKADRLKALQAQSAAELDALLPAILDKAFKGELVSPEPITIPERPSTSDEVVVSGRTAARRAQDAEIDRGKKKAFILCLLHEYARRAGPSGRAEMDRQVLDLGLVLMLNDDLRCAFVDQAPKVKRPGRRKAMRHVVAQGMNPILATMQEHSAVQVTVLDGVQFIVLGAQATPFEEFPRSFVQKARDTMDALQAIEMSQALAYFNERAPSDEYELVPGGAETD
jgi:type I restriction enzyme S subunit